MTFVKWLSVSAVMISLCLAVLFIFQYKPDWLKNEVFDNTTYNGGNFTGFANIVLQLGNKINEVVISLHQNLVVAEKGNFSDYNESFVDPDKHSTLVVEKVIGGLRFPTGFIFLDSGDILFLEKDSGQVRKIINNSKISEPLLRVNVANKGENGMLGIATSKVEKTGKTNLFLYFTEALRGSGGYNFSNNYNASANRLYKYEMNDQVLSNPELLLDLPGGSSGMHNGGKIVIGPDNNLYIIIGDTGDSIRSAAQNAVDKNGLAKRFDGTSSILRVSQDGKPVKGIISNDSAGQKVYAYGIRNGFGLDFDPITGDLWDTENGPAYGDEINLVKPGFNSGWNKVQGPWSFTRDDFYPKHDNITHNPRGLLDFNGTGKYRSPELTWNKTVAPTAIKFLNSNKLGNEFENDLFVGDISNGNLYHFDLNKNRSGLILNEDLVDKIVNTEAEIKSSIMLTGLGGITDIRVGPDGYLYFSTLGKPYYEEEVSPSTDGSIYRIRPRGN